MFPDDKAGHYTLTTRAKAGILPDGRSRIGKSAKCFIRWLKQPFGDDWNELQEARLQVGIPALVFFLSCKMLNDKSQILSDFKWAHNSLVGLIKDISDLANKAPKSKVPTLQEWIKQEKTKGKNK